MLFSLELTLYGRFEPKNNFDFELIMSFKGIFLVF